MTTRTLQLKELVMANAMQIVCPHCDSVNQVSWARLGNRPKRGHWNAALFTGKPVALDAAGFDTHLTRRALVHFADGG